MQNILLVKYNRIKHKLNGEIKSVFKGCYVFIVITLFPFITSEVSLLHGMDLSFGFI